MDTLTCPPPVVVGCPIFFKPVWKPEQKYQTHMAHALSKAFRRYFSSFNWVNNNGRLTCRPVKCKQSSWFEIAIDVYHAENLLFLPSDPAVLRGLNEITVKGHNWQIFVTCNDGNCDRILFKDGSFYFANLYFTSEEGQKELGVPK